MKVDGRKIHKKRTVRFSVSMALVFALFVSLWTLDAEFYAAGTRMGVVVSPDGSLVETFDAPSTSAGHVSNLQGGKELTILKETTGDDGRLWYQVSYPNLYNPSIIKTAYIPATYVTITSSTSSSDTQGGTDSVMAVGTVNVDDLYVRNAPGTSGTYRLTSVNRGDTVQIVGQTTVNGEVWYNVTCTVGGKFYNGWSCGMYIDITYTGADTGGDYAAQLRSAGFPESYLSNLVALHNKYPNWTFEAVKTGLDWSAVIAGESTNGRNVVQNSSDDAMKSTASGAYNYSNNTWTIYDGSSWVSAHPDYIAYCMDPRNFLDETNIFQFESLSYRSSQNLAGVQSILKGTFMDGSVKDSDGKTFSYAQAFVDIGKAEGVSPYHLASRVRQEQGAGTSALISGTYSGYQGYYNYFNVRAYGPTTAEVIKSGLAYAKQQGWNTRYKSLQGGAKLLAQNYIAVGQDTLYFQKFNVVNQKGPLYAHQYMSNVTAAITEGRKMGQGYTDKQQAFVFRIPVYNNMPAAAVKFTASGNPNNYLKELSIAGLSLTPAFQGGTTAYSVVVENSVTSVTVSAKAVAATSSVSGTGSYQLAVGSNTIKVDCRSQSGAVRTYTITVSRKEAPAAPLAPQEGGYSVKSSKYTIGTNITGVAPETSAADFLKAVTISGCTVKLLDASGAENTKTVGTGNKLAVYVNGSLKATYGVVIYGDVNGDGVIKANDLFAINRHILGKAKLKDVYLLAGDVNKKGDGVSASDLFMVNRHLLGTQKIAQ